jgi:AcrR family transcriptional regulator
MPKVTEAHLEARRSQILDAAWTCFARKGYHQATMQDICQESGLSPGAIYRYFESKEAILKAIADRSTEMNRALFDVARSEAEDPMDALELLAQAMLSMFNDPMFETWARLDVETRPEFLRNEALRESAKKQLTFWRTALAQLLAEAKEKGQLKAEVDPEALAVLIISAWEGLRQFRLMDPENFKPDCIDFMRTLVSKNSFAEGKKSGDLPSTLASALDRRLPLRRSGRKEGD